MPEKTVYIETVGCQMNVLDSELVIGALKRKGYVLTDAAADADVLLFNTCSVREHAEEKVYSALGRIAPHKKRNPGTVVGVIGCMAQKDQEKIRARAPYVDMVVGTGQLGQIPALIDAVKETRQPQYALSLGRSDGGRHEVEASFESYDPVRDAAMRPTPFQAFVRIQIGCDKFCTYCVVPSTRGPEQSRHPDHLVAEVRQLVDQGCKEVTLLGQTVNSYEYALGDGRRSRLSDLLARMHDTPGLERIKFVTNYPKDMTDDLLDAVHELPKVCKYLHVPVQSGCDEVLSRMKRNYTASFYMEMLARCREMVPGVAVSSDFIVGFCGETEESFQKSMDLVAKAKFKNSFIFKYSERPGTKAMDRFPDDISEDVKKRRNNDLLMVQNANSLVDHRAWIGRTVEVLVEGPSRHGHREAGPVKQLIGRTMTDHITVFDGHDRLVGQTVTLDVTDASAFTLYGTVRTGEQVGVTCAAEPAPREEGAKRIGLALV
ncbi:tRNA (N6-isopentenyl adenosine(37)-C2)-methylthiotransferase MiaB [Fimbriiglobus ruber]|uniref:tRNA-2-methylthio-N(6)-dimethylallyladenosine synthase n=1 Tax=Fimbriiglobus ruber TaxID=1908690 RepID=A0A225DZZ8_9BACT|nr:tRNA (N6-isopentenyl adenosine(37)-C2)-methylthiotransferase MiaB [Fimbriiglobus ruber]OWK45144.1 tRNA-i(6)A37 methylthiotransferase [Fimbriiglobus ruber]